MKKEQQKLIKKGIKIIGKIIFILSIVFVVRAVYVLGFDFEAVDNWPMFLAVAAVCTVVKTISVYLSGSAWYGWLSFFSGKTGIYREAICVHAKANIGKYLPGNVMHYVERNLFADKLEISQKKLAASSIFEVFSLVSVALLMAITVSFGQLQSALFNIFGDNYVQIVVGVILAGIAVVVLGFLLFKKKIMSVLSDYTLSGFFKAMLKNMCLYAKQFPADYAACLYQNLCDAEQIRMKLLKINTFKEWMKKNGIK